MTWKTFSPDALRQNRARVTHLSARKGKGIVREGMGGDSREVPLVDQAARAAVAGWKNAVYRILDNHGQTKEMIQIIQVA